MRCSKIACDWHLFAILKSGPPKIGFRKRMSSVMKRASKPIDAHKAAAKIRFSSQRTGRRISMSFLPLRFSRAASCEGMARGLIRNFPIMLSMSSKNPTATTLRKMATASKDSSPSAEVRTMTVVETTREGSNFLRSVWKTCVQ